MKEANYICQIDGHNTVNSVTSSEEESEHLSESENDNTSKDEMEHSDENLTENETESESESETGNDDVLNISVVIGNRPAPVVPENRQPTRLTVKRSNDLVNALSAPRVTLYNVRSAWRKWTNISEDIKMR